MMIKKVDESSFCGQQGINLQHVRSQCSSTIKGITACRAVSTWGWLQGFQVQGNPLGRAGLLLSEFLHFFPPAYTCPTPNLFQATQPLLTLEFRGTFTLCESLALPTGTFTQEPPSEALLCCPARPRQLVQKDRGKGTPGESFPTQPWQGHLASLPTVLIFTMSMAHQLASTIY